VRELNETAQLDRSRCDVTQPGQSSSQRVPTIWEDPGSTSLILRWEKTVPLLLKHLVLTSP